MKLSKYIIGTLLLGGTLNFASCSLDYDPIASYSDVTEGIHDEEDNQQEFQTQADVESALEALYQKMKDRMEHWYLDNLLVGDSHADNAYAGTTGAETVPFENNTVDGGNTVLERDWTRYLEDVAAATVSFVTSIRCPTKASLPMPATASRHRPRYSVHSSGSIWFACGAMYL